ncbi:hypothetical protein B0H19DRAFT_1072844 [Mycena capillaripes]|nr:hypothetical protein B0H19DRAFT_1072844 [Mycena capillaripes]
MSQPLGRRGRCRLCDGCGSFISSNSASSGPNYIAGNASESCAVCSHGWIHHLALASTDGSDPYCKGICIPAACGGFCPRSTTDAWTFIALCVCGQPWSNHEMLVESVIPSAPALSGSQPPPPSVPPPLALLQPSLPNPVRAFTGLAPSGSTSSSGSASANENRNAAIARHFPRGKYKPPRPFPASTVAVPSFQVLIALWPNVMPGTAAADDIGGPTIDFAYTIDQFTEMLLMLKAHHLVFVATLPSADQSNIIQELSSQLSTNLATHNLVLPAGASTSDGPVPWFRLPWMVLEPSRRKTVYTFAQHARANTNNFNRKMILDINSKFGNPDIEHSSLPLIVLGDGHYQDVKCLGALCPDDDPPPASLPSRLPRRRERTPSAMVASTSQIRSRSPFSLTPSPPRNRRRLGSSPYIEVLSSDDKDPLLPPRRTNPPRNTQLPDVSAAQVPTVLAAQPPTQIRLATGSEITAWQREIWIEVASVPDSQTVRIVGANITAMSEFIIALFYHLRMTQFNPSSAPPFPRPAAIDRPRTGMTHLSFLQSEMHRGYHLSNSLGRGVEQAVWRHVLSLLTEDTQFWQPSAAEPEHVTFLLSPVSSGPERTARLYAHGQLIAIHLYYYGHGLSLISPDIASELRPWFALGADDPMPSFLTAPPSQVPFPRSPTQHDDITVKLMSRKLLGCEPWTHLDFQSARDGFNMPISNYATFGDYLRGLPPLEAACLIAGMYRRQIQSLQDVLGHIFFLVLGPSTAPPEVALMRSLFEHRLKRYLAGRGHPQRCRDNGLVATDEEVHRGSAIPFLRPQLLLLTALESSLLPVKDTWGIRFTVSDHTQPGTDTRPHSEALPLQFHTCSGGVDVRVNPRLFDMMIKSPRGDEDTEFDVWMHSQIYNADLAYNRI